jgi:ATP-binding cassette, subfamily B, multidrug efflux pump
MGSLIRLFRYLRSYSGLVIVSLTFLLISTLLNLVQPKLVEWAVDYGISQGAARSVVIGALGIFAAALLGAGLNYSSGVMLIKAGQGMGFDIRNALFKKVMSFSFANFDKWRTGELLVRVNSDVNTVRMFVRMGLLMIIQSFVMLIGSLIVMFLTNARLSIVMAIVLPGTLIFFFVSASFLRPMFLKVRKRLDAVNNGLQENLSGAKVVRAFAQQDHEIELFKKRNTDYLKMSLKIGYTIAIVFPFLFFLGQLSVLFTAWFGGVAVIENILVPIPGGLTIGQLLAFNNYALMAMWPIISLGMVLNFTSRASASAQRIEELMSEKPSIHESDSPIQSDRLKGRIVFQDVSFKYGEGENAVDAIGLTVQAGEKIGILGRTGAGKSSLANLIPRFYEADTGSITIDDTDIKDMSLSTLRQRISLVLQETILMSGTIRENLAFGKPDAADDELTHAAEIACAREFIEEKADGWNEFVGERGAGLSGGQRQRVAIARAILSDPDILILDDVTSSLDARTERQIVANLYGQLDNKTVLIISQKVNTIMLADRIVLMDNGRIIAEGTHEELLESDGMYREIYETQSAEIRA